MSVRDDLDRRLMADAVIDELKQFDKLRAITPLLTVEELAHRMAWSVKNVRWLLKKMKDTRG